MEMCKECVEFMYIRAQKDRKYMVAAYSWAIVVDVIMVLFIYTIHSITTNLLWCLPIIIDLVLGSACVVLAVLQRNRVEKRVLRYKCLALLSQSILGFIYFDFGCIAVLSAITFIILSGMWIYRILVLDIYITYIKNLLITGGV